MASSSSRTFASKSEQREAKISTLRVEPAERAQCLHHAYDGGKDLFVHHTAVQGSGFNPLAEGANVSH